MRIKNFEMTKTWQKTESTVFVPFSIGYVSNNKNFLKEVKDQEFKDLLIKESKDYRDKSRR